MKQSNLQKEWVKLLQKSFMSEISPYSADLIKLFERKITQAFL